MRSFMKRRVLWGLLLAGMITCVGVWFFLLRPPPDMRAYLSVRAELLATRDDADEAARDRLASRCLDIAGQFPGSMGGVSALLLASTRASDTTAGREARRQFAREVKTADIKHLARAFDWGLGRLETIQDLAPAILARARQSPDHSRTARLIAAVCSMTRPGEGGQPSSLYSEAADLIADRHADSPDIASFCEELGVSPSGSPPWAGRFEKHLRTILEMNHDRKVRCAAQFALASIVQSSTEDRQAEAEVLFEQFCSEFDGKRSYRYQQIEQYLRHLAQDQLKELRFRAVGKPAPAIAGIDLDGRPMTLNQYRGRVVLLSFWGTWCFPCMKLIPHELELAGRFRDQPFEIVGVNCDSNVEKARQAAARNKMTWRSFRDQSGEGPAITSHWKILGYPTLYLVDHHGMIRKRWIGSPSPEELAHAVGVLVDAARRSVPPDAMRPITAALQFHPSAGKATQANQEASIAPRPGTGFLDKIYREPDGSEVRYGVFIPRSYDGSKPFPAILFLHGAGSRGSDGARHMQHGLAKAIRHRKEDFPFIVIFPQAREGESWIAGSAGGKRAIAILNRLQTDYCIDANRISLSGLSMGGEGTWSLAAADPGRWAAMVPICHGSDPKSADRLKAVPCWCFHGDADKVIPIQRSREMIQAIRDAGGRPLYHEFSGVDHDSCADRAYAMPELFEWMLLQNRAKRS
jgi:thiol-disulfide isomerase/thioredoxin/predicted esterase